MTAKNSSMINTVNYYKIRLSRIGKGAFERCNHLKEITLPEGINEICENAFNWWHNLQNILLPSHISGSKGYIRFMRSFSLKFVTFLLMDLTTSRNRFSQGRV